MSPSAPMVFQGVKRVAVIGGGDLMLHTASRLLECGLSVIAVLAPRHANEVLAVDRRLTTKALSDCGVTSMVIDNIDQWEPDADLALCFGPAWIFPERIRRAFPMGMINFNGIPIPHYLGGAHYSWQILNRDRRSGCVLQEITSDLDRGPILRFHLFALPPHVRTPLDYFAANWSIGREFLDQAINDMLAGKEFARTSYATIDGDRLYFPRLNTAANGYIDWSWDVGDVEAFCCAFDDPYAGAGSYVGETEIRLKSVHAESCTVTFHPFAAGLIVRRLKSEIWVAARGGLLRIGRVVGHDGGNPGVKLTEGVRLHTPFNMLERARGYAARFNAQGLSAEANG